MDAIVAGFLRVLKLGRMSCASESLSCLSVSFENDNAVVGVALYACVDECCCDEDSCDALVMVSLTCVSVCCVAVEARCCVSCEWNLALN